MDSDSETLSDGGAETLTSLGSASEQAFSVERLQQQRPANPHPWLAAGASSAATQILRRRYPHPLRALGAAAPLPVH
jgi:hypothetical protein